MSQKNIFRRNAKRFSHIAPREGHFEKCNIKNLCRSCKYVNQSYEASLQEKYLEGIQTLKSAGVLAQAIVMDPVPSPRKLGYRAHFKLAVRRDPESSSGSGVLIGLFKPNSHDVVDLSYCPLHVPALGKLVRSLKRVIEEEGISAYDERNQSGTLRYILARAAHRTEEIQLTFVVTEPKKEVLRRLAKKLQAAGHKINSCHMNINTSKGNAIVGPETVLVSGVPRLRERLCDLDLEVSPTSFFQVNPWTAELLYSRVASIAGFGQGQAVAWDLYTGTGQIALLLARAGFRVFGIEETPSAIEDAQLNATRNDLERGVEFLTGRVEEHTVNFPTWATLPKVVVCNPSRRGIEANARAFLAERLKTARAQLIYVSCSIETLARDLAHFKEFGLELRQIECFDMFPQTDKMEWIGVIK